MNHERANYYPRPVAGGFVVVRHDDLTGRREYVGGDGFWCREARHCVPATDEAAAQALMLRVRPPIRVRDAEAGDRRR